MTGGLRYNIIPFFHKRIRDLNKQKLKDELEHGYWIRWLKRKGIPRPFLVRMKHMPHDIAAQIRLSFNQLIKDPRARE